MSAASSPRLWKHFDRNREVQTPARLHHMSQPQEQPDQLASHSHLVQEGRLDSSAAQFGLFHDLNHHDVPFDHPTNESYSTAETVADSEDIPQSSIEPQPFDYGLESTSIPFPNFEDGYILPMDFDPLDPFKSIADETENTRLLELVPHHHSVFAGFASHDNQLMSPQLTDTASPGSGFGDPSSPVERIRLLGGGPMSGISSQSTSTDHPASLCQNTPALTGCSAEASPEPVVGPNAFTMENNNTPFENEHRPINHTINLRLGPEELPTHLNHVNQPVVRVEKYSRGDSPARTEGSGGRGVGKRSRSAYSAFHLAAPSDMSSLYEVEQDEHESGSHVTRVGFDPAARIHTTDAVPNFSDREATAHWETVKCEVEEWLSKVSIADLPTTRPQGSRRRAQSTSDGVVHVLAGADTPSISGQRLAEANARIPGPGLRVQEDSDNDIEESSQEREDASEGVPTSPIAIIDSKRPDLEDTLRNLGARPWEDPICLPSLNSQSQPQTSQIAMTRFLMKAADIETASRKATWGTTVRRMSETDLEKLLGPEGLLSRLSVGRDKIMEIMDRRGSMLASRLLPKRSPSTTKTRPSESPTQDSEAVSGGGPLEVLQSRKDSLHARKESYGDRPDFSSRTSTGSLRRMASNSKPRKSPKVHTGGAVAAIASQVAVIGANGSISPTATSSPTRGWNTARNIIRRKSRGESHRPVNENHEPGLTALWTQHGGPPLPTLASPPEEEVAAIPFSPMDAEIERVKEEQIVSMDFTPQPDGIIPTKEGFKISIQRVNPRILPFLAERLAREQLARYKKLVKLKVDHTEAVRAGNCTSGKYCVHLGGQPSYPPSRTNKKDVEISHTGFSQTVVSSAEDDGDASSEGLVMASQFPEGVPIPPVVRLPAEFECPLCFVVKKIQKPSDWSKHVHEDLQPFTCTFADCNEPKPKSFKRKADWVRHENERHRQLEWWTCNKPDCQHKCYRRDNFVQHLVREHKLADPNAKPVRSNKPAVRGPGKKTKVNDGADSIPCDDEVLTMVTKCRSDTTSQPQSEVCRFCSNICTSWKKLTVHLAKHMEQISIPILKLVEEREVSPDTIISPIEQQQSRAASTLRTHETDLMQEEVSVYAKANNGFNPAFSSRASPLSGDNHNLYQGAQVAPAPPNRLQNNGNLFPPSRLDARGSWSKSDRHSTNRGSQSGLGLDQSASGTFGPLYTSSEQIDQSTFTPVNILPTTSAAFHAPTGYSGPISPIANGRPTSYIVNSGFTGNSQPYQNQEFAYHPQFAQPHFSSSEVPIRQDDSIMPQYRSASSTPFQQSLNFDPSISPQVQHFYPYST